MTPSRLLLRLRNRSVWKDPQRKVLTLESFAETEADGGKDLVAAARKISEPDLREHVLRHAEDEERHARLFRGRAAELRAALALAPDAGRSDKAYDLSRGRRGEQSGKPEGRVSFVVPAHDRFVLAALRAHFRS